MQYVVYTLPYCQGPACWSDRCKLASVCTNTCLLLLGHLVGLHPAQKKAFEAVTGQISRITMCQACIMQAGTVETFVFADSSHEARALHAPSLS